MPNLPFHRFPKNAVTEDFVWVPSPKTPRPVRSNASDRTKPSATSPVLRAQGHQRGGLADISRGQLGWEGEEGEECEEKELVLYRS